ncbi:MAG: glucokinase [Gammaproteobacteria bacterium]
MKVLGCDLGGTHTRLLLADCRGGRCDPCDEHFYDSGAFDDLAPILQDFMARRPVAGDPPHAACIAVAGPVTATSGGGQRAKVTNLPWDLDSARLAEAAGIATVKLINDFEAIGYGIGALSADDRVTLQEGEPQPEYPRAVIGAGTGLGQAIVLGADDRERVLATEGGHADFAPTDELQVELLRSVRGERGRVSYEALLSGSGLVRIFRFLCAHYGREPTTDLAAAMAAGDAAAAVSQHGLQRLDPVADQALDLFVAIYGAQAGNLGLTCMARGGVYVAGGIAPKILERMRRGPFLAHFRDKGKMTELMHQLPVHVITDTRIGLHGAVRLAARLG